MKNLRQDESKLELRLGRGIAHVVEYTAYAKNPNAVEMMEAAAKEYLSTSEGHMEIIFGRPYNTGRAVGKNDYDFGIVGMFPNEKGMQFYMSEDLNHKKWVNFVLNGYQVPNSTLKSVQERKAEFIEKVLYGTEKFEWTRDPKVPDSEVVWGGERVKDLGTI